MGWRTQKGGRCEKCWLRLESCVCAELPKIQNLLKVFVLLHPKEQWRTSNTGRLANLCLYNSEVELRTLENLPDYQPRPYTQSEKVYVLFPTLDAEVLSPQLGAKMIQENATLLIPDGSWRQAGKMVAHIPALKNSPAVKLPPLKFRSQYLLRRASDPTRISTIEAIAHSLAILENPEYLPLLLAAQSMVVTRTLKARGSYDRILKEMTDN